MLITRPTTRETPNTGRDRRRTYRIASRAIWMTCASVMAFSPFLIVAFPGHRPGPHRPLPLLPPGREPQRKLSTSDLTTRYHPST
ncbi:MAG: hypothetical protein ACPLRH_04705, partial [Desulfotomaculales bacterium]